MTDIHYYQCFGEYWEQRSPFEHLKAPFDNRMPELESYGKKGWIVVGEWSLRLRSEQSWDPPFQNNGLEKDLYMRSFAANQLLAYEQTQGWFFWSYKAENQPEWSFRDCVERGWMPNQFN